MKRKVVFFDRDGTLIDDKIYLNNPNDIEYFEGIIPALKKLRDHGYEFVIVTNQSGLARGCVQIENLKVIHQKIRGFLASHGIDILDFYYAHYLPITEHPLRKPSPGMLLEAAYNYNIDLKNSWMVGDRMTDIEAGHRAGTKTILLGDLENPKDFDFDPPEGYAKNLLDVADFILT